MTPATVREPTRAAAEPAVPRIGFRPRIALLVDVHDWAFGNIARHIAAHLSDRYDFATVPVEWVGSFERALMAASDADLIHVFWREYLSRLEWPDVVRACRTTHGSVESFVAATIGRRPLTTSVYDHLFLGPDEVAPRAALFSRYVRGYTVSSAKLRAIYEALPGFPPPGASTPDGVDLGLFRPAPPRPTHDGALVVGWVGNSAWSADMHVDHKGLRTVLLPAIDALRAEGLNIRLETVDRARGPRPQHEMPAFYAQIDVYACVSLHEGTPNPVLEAMASGVPVVSTDVGIVPEAFGPLQRQMILAERSVPALVATLRRLHADPGLRARLRQENLESIRAWDWSLRARPFDDFFSRMLERCR
jgi:glycosyltransferase involved in cell wall biosynthesis